MSGDQFLALGLVLVALAAVAGMCITFYVLLKEARAEQQRRVNNFRHHFPGRCMICSHHQYGLHMGFVDPSVTVEQHHCVEKSAAQQHH